MGTEQLSGFLVEDDLYQALVLAKSNRLAVTHEGKSADPNVELLFLGRLLCKPNGGDLRRAISAARDHQFIHRVRIEALDRLDADDAFMFGLVRQHRRSRNITDGIDSGNICLVELIDDDNAAISLYTEFFQAKIFDIANDPNRRNGALYGDRLQLPGLFNGRGDAIAFPVELRHFRIRVNFNALLLKALASKGLDFLILNRQNLRQHL